MAKLFNLARMTTATTGTGTITLGAAVSGWLTFALSGAQDGDVVPYTIRDGANSESGTGTYTASGTTLSRTVRKSTNSDNAISLSGAAEVYITALAEDLRESGTAFPAQPAYGNNRPFFRTDRGLEYYYDGTRWLTVQQYVIQMLPYVSLGAVAMTATTAFKMIGWKPCAAATDFWMENAIVAATVSTTNNGSNHFIIEFESDDATSGSPTDIVDINTFTDGAWTVSEYSVATKAINALLGTGQRIVSIDCTEVGTSGLALYDAKIVGRLVG